MAWPRTKQVARDSAAYRLMMERQRTKGAGTRDPNKVAREAIEEYYQLREQSRDLTKKWLDGGEGCQTDSDTDAANRVKEQIRGNNNTLSSREIERALREARKDDPRYR